MGGVCRKISSFFDVFCVKRRNLKKRDNESLRNEKLHFFTMGVGSILNWALDPPWGGNEREHFSVRLEQTSSL